MTSIHWDTVTRLRRLYAQAMDPVCRRFGLTANEMGVLLFLANNPQYTRAADIVNVRGIAKSHVSAAVSARGAAGREGASFPPPMESFSVQPSSVHSRPVSPLARITRASCSMVSTFIQISPH